MTEYCKLKPYEHITSEIIIQIETCSLEHTFENVVYKMATICMGDNVLNATEWPLEG